MRRAPIVIAATCAGVGAVLGFHSHPTAQRAVAPAASAAASSTSSTSSSGGNSALGEAMQTRYGAAQVRVTVSGGKIVKVEAVQLQNGDPKSSQISGYAAPILQQSVLTTQTAAVDAVSGATYTSLSYEGSLQSALDKLAFKAADGTVASTDMSQLQ
jgi:uncharacterized protein with FMN-binding domain